MATTSSSRTPWMYLFLGLSVACSGAAPEPDDGNRQELLFTFGEGAQGWSPGFTDLAPEQVPDVGFFFDRRPLPPSVGDTGVGLYLSGDNVSDDLFMFLTLPVTGLLPETPYTLTFELELVSNAPSSCVGTGGAPGESVFLKAGAAPVQPEQVTDATGDYRLNVDKGNQATGGAHARVLGHIANDVPNCSRAVYQHIRRDNLADPLTVTTDAQGRLWLFVGTDSGFEGRTELYYDAIRVVLEPAQG